MTKTFGTFSSVQFSSVQSLSCVQLFATPWIAAPTPGVHPNSCPSSRWCHPAISSSVVPLSSCPQSLPAAESFPKSQLFAWGGQSIGVSALTSVLPKNTQDWSPLEWTGWTSFQSKGLSRVFSNTTVQKHQFFGTQLSSQSLAKTEHKIVLLKKKHLLLVIAFFTARTIKKKKERKKKKRERPKKGKRSSLV